MDEQIIADVKQWLDEVVIGLDLCPFAARPRREKRVRIVVSHATDEEALLNDLQAELERLSDTPAAELETTLLAIPDMLEDFADYNDFLDAVDLWVEQFGWEGDLQVASFHPQYQFADTEPTIRATSPTARPGRCCTSSARKAWRRPSSTIPTSTPFRSATSSA